MFRWCCLFVFSCCFVVCVGFGGGGGGREAVLFCVFFLLVFVLQPAFALQLTFYLGQFQFCTLLLA